MKKTKKGNAVIVAFVSFFVVVLAVCAFVSCGMQSGNIAINLPPIESHARAIAPDKVDGLKTATKSYRVAVEANGHLEEKRGDTGSYMFSVPVGAVAEITLECLNGNGEVIVRVVKTIKVYAGVNNVDIKLSQDGDEIIPPELKGTPQIGSIIMKDGTLRTSADIGNDTANAIAVVYKVAGRKVWAVGKELSSSTMIWAVNGSEGLMKNITDLQKESGYTDGSTGLAILLAAVSDADGANLATNYPAWDYACNYGRNQGLDNFQTGWYLPSRQELQEVYDNKDAIEATLAKIGVSKISFSGNYYSSSQIASLTNYAYLLKFDSGAWQNGINKASSGYVCAVRQFTW